MKRWWLAGSLLVVVLGSAIASTPRLGYDMSGLDETGGFRPAHREIAPTPATIPARASETPAAWEFGPPAAEPPPPGGLRILVSLPQQRLYLFRGAELVATSPVSTGRPGHGTPAGTFHITQKDVHHRSNIYSNAPMPYMQRITNSGIALHAGHLPGYPASHGCIRMPWGFAQALFTMTSYGTPVTITRASPADAGPALALVRAAPTPPPTIYAANERLDPDDYVSWH